ncbi:MAG: hypothetical protein AAGJ35_14985, partial [Myxococcota bacterium]
MKEAFSVTLIYRNFCSSYYFLTQKPSETSKYRDIRFVLSRRRGYLLEEIRIEFISKWLVSQGSIERIGKKWKR